MSNVIPTSEQTSRATRLIGLLCDTSIPAEQMAELDQLVVRFPQIRRRYVELMSLHADMRQQAALLRPQDSTDSSAIDAIVELVTRQRQQSPPGFSKVASDSDSEVTNADLNDTLILPAIAPDALTLLEDEDRVIDPPMTIGQPQVRKFSMLRIVAAIALPLLTLSVFWAMRSRSHVTPIANPFTGASPQCIVDLALNARLAGANDLIPGVGMELRPGMHNLDAGIIKLELPHNAVVVLEAPARFEVLSSNKVRILEGKLSAQLVKGGGLTVVTPDLTAVDIGTEFAVDVTAGKQTYLEVFQGAVRTTSTNSGISKTFTDVVAGEAVVVTTGSSAIVSDLPRPLAFIRPAELQPADDTPYQRWSRFSQTIRQDSDLAAYYPFDADSVAADQLENRAKQTLGNYTGYMGAAGYAGSSPQWTEGRWRGKSALQFGGTQLKAVTVKAQPELFSKNAMTLCCWIKRDELDKSFHILAGEAEGGRAFNLGVIGSESVGPANCINVTWAQFNVASSPAPFQANHWEFVAVTATVKNGTAFYLDGKLISVNGSPSSTPVAVNQLVIGAPVPGNPLSNAVDYFNGSIDELFIFRRALSGKEIEHLFEIGRPD